MDNTINEEFEVSPADWELPLPAALQSTPGSVAPWPPRLSFDVAMGTFENEQLCATYDIAPEELDRLFYFPPFRREVANHERDLRENGVTFKAKAKVQAEIYLEELNSILYASDTPPSVRLAIVQSVVKWAGLEPKPEPANSGNSGTSVTINITRFSDAVSEAITIE